jgi:hypothetical protein
MVWRLEDYLSKLVIPFRHPFRFGHWNGISQYRSIPAFRFRFTTNIYIYILFSVSFSFEAPSVFESISHFLRAYPINMRRLSFSYTHGS